MPGLQVHPTDRRWLADAAGRPLWLTGSHHWDSLVDNGERPGGFDWPGYLERLGRWGHGCVRLWAQEAWIHPLSHHPWARSGPGLAHDGRPRFDLDRLDEAYFARLRQRVAEAGARRLQVVVMLFNGWSLHDNGAGDPWPYHPFHRDNNVNGVDGDPAGQGHGRAAHALDVAAVTRAQRRYVAAVAAAVGDAPHVLWEVANESPGESLPWQAEVAGWLREADRERGLARPVGITSCFPRGSNRALFATTADWVAPNRKGGWMRTPPPVRGGPAVLVDSDHLWGIGGDAAWVWRAALRGYPVLYMDPLDDDPVREGARRAMGAVRALMEGLDLTTIQPWPAMASGGCCLGDPTPGRERVVAWARRRWLWLDLRPIGGPLAATWIHPTTGERRPAGAVAGGRFALLRAPWRGGAALSLERAPATEPLVGRRSR